MLTPRELSRLPEELIELWEKLERDILTDIAERLANDTVVSGTAEYRLMKLQQMGLQQDYLIEKLNEVIQKSNLQVSIDIRKAVVASVNRDNVIFKEAYELGLIPAFNMPNNILNSLVTKGVKEINDEIKLFTRTYAKEVNKYFENTLENMYLQIRSGLYSHSEAVKTAIDDLANKGVTGFIQSSSGRNESVETVIKRIMRTGGNQTALKAQEANFFAMGGTLVEVTAHWGARPSHAEWQGGIYEWVFGKKVTSYPDFVKVTGYGTGEGLGGWNCRHNFFPYFEGMSVKTYQKLDLDKNEKIYKLEQKLNQQKSALRKAETQSSILNASNQDTAVVSRNIKSLNAAIKQTTSMLNLAYDYEVNLTPTDIHTINQYLGSYSYIINEKLRNGYALDELDQSFITEFDEVLNKLQDYQGKVIRDLHLYPDTVKEFLLDYKVGNTMNFKQYISTTTLMSYNDSANVRYYIKSITGKDIRYYNSKEAEILFLRETEFKVTSIKFNDIIEIYMEEVK